MGVVGRQPIGHRAGTVLIARAGRIGDTEPLNYSDKVQEIFAPAGGHTRKDSTTRFVLLEESPLDVAVKGVSYRIQIEQESVSKEWRLFAVNLESAKAGNYSAWLLQTAASKEAIEKRMFCEGLEFNPNQGGFGIFKQLVRSGYAKELTAD